jgi:hypothetical protein
MKWILALSEVNIWQPLLKKCNKLLGIVNGGKVLNSRTNPSFYEGSVAKRYFPV